jgi:hypothetical protein
MYLVIYCDGDDGVQRRCSMLEAIRKAENVKDNRFQNAKQTLKVHAERRVGRMSHQKGIKGPS